MEEWFSRHADVLAQLPRMEGVEPYTVVIRHGTMRVGLYAPHGVDEQGPHEQDELYIVATGSGNFRRGEQCREVRAGDVFFVGAHETHRFEDFTEDFSTWVIFWGPAGGEPDAAAGS